MRLRYRYVVAVAVVFAAVGGWAVGATQHGDCQYSCPAHGPCPEPAECLRHPFGWGAALVFGIMIALLIGGIGVLVVRNDRRA